MTSHFPSLPLHVLKSLHAYLLNISLLSPSWSEHSYAYLLNPGGSGRFPMEDRIHELVPHKIPIVFAYGTRDWMDPYAGGRSVEVLNRAWKEEGETGKCRLVLIKDAAHQGK